MIRASLKERIKELDCLYAISTMLVEQDLSLTDALNRMARIVPSAFSLPKRTGAVIHYAESCYTFNAGGAVIASEPIVVNGAVAGTLSVVMDMGAGPAEPPVLEEERRLLKAVAELAASIVTKIQSEQSLRQAAQELRDKNGALREILFQVEAEQKRSRDLPTTLSPREHEVCLLIRRGLSSKEIADQLHISSMTVEKHRHGIRKKLGLINSRTNLAVFLRNR